MRCIVGYGYGMGMRMGMDMHVGMYEHASHVAIVNVLVYIHKQLHVICFLYGGTCKHISNLLYIQANVLKSTK
ncbi:hypothetical protein EON63_13850 [archaeon]|nr:MAG: hypothetical protein EON63_13850 [archaeon]